ncbi:MAG TPA: glycosyl hydrolase, partial [Gemmatimonadaceae bacterium]|nr:glycosyl hydrolase [Gemmatimonadaceae bacterium]
MRQSLHPRRLAQAAAAAALVAAGIVTAPVATAPLAAQRSARAAAAGAPAQPASAAAPAAYDSAAFAAYGWREIGPYRGGRSVAVAGSMARPDEYWMGTVGGGVFKSTNGGRDWDPVTDRYFGGSIGAITVDERNPDIVWVGTGETPIRGNVTHGEGLWRTTDGGKTWAYMGLRDTRQIARVRLHPTNANRVYVAALGNVFLPTKERGVYRSDDAGKTWKKILFRDDSTGAIDLVADPSNPDVMYASFWQAGRTPWTLSSGGKGSGIFKTTNGGDTWTEISRAPGLPRGLLGKIGLAVSPVNPKRLWALIEADEGGVFRSDDAGATWTRVNEDRSLRQRAWYYSRVFADPKDENTLYALNVSFFRSTDGGKTFKTIPTPHSDNHDLWIAPDDPARMIEGNDGGANVSTDTARTWTEQDYATAQMYHVTTTNHFPYHICGAQQDNSTLCGPSRNPGGITTADWQEAGGGESGYIAADPRNPDIIYAGSYGGLLTRKDMRTGLTRNVSPWPLNPMGQSSEDIELRFQWTFPIVFSRHTPGVLYAGGSQLFRTTDEGQSWEIVSPPLGRNDPKTMGPSGGPITRDQTGVETYGTIFAFDESPVTPGLLWAGSDDGLIHISRDNAKTWNRVTPPESLLPDFARISIIEPSPYDAGTAYVAANRYQMGDMRPYILKTTDYGKSWTKITAGIEGDGEFTRVVRADPVRRGLLFAGTERGVWISFDDGARWQRLPVTLPPVPVHDMVIKEGDLVVATHGRSFYVLDDLSTIRQMQPEVLAKAAHLFQPRDAYRTQWSGRGRRGGGSTVGQNPASGAVVRYWLKDGGR